MHDKATISSRSDRMPISEKGRVAFKDILRYPSDIEINCLFLKNDLSFLFLIYNPNLTSISLHRPSLSGSSFRSSSNHCLISIVVTFLFPASMSMYLRE